MKTVAIGIARLGSTRLPGKVLFDLGGKPVLQWVVDALRAAPSVDEVWIATSTLDRDDRIADYCRNWGIPCFRGSETDVLARVYQCATEAKADVIVRATCDCPLLDPAVVEQVIQLRAMTYADYASNVDPPTWPDGQDCEAFVHDVLRIAHSDATRASDRDCVTRFIARNRWRFKSETLICPLPGLHKERWVLDTEDDLNFCNAIVSRLKHSRSPSYLEILKILQEDPWIRQFNANHPRNERFFEQVATEDRPNPVFDNSTSIFEVARSVIPLGAQTFSKSHVQYPAGHAPLFCTHGDGAYLFDVDGNDYVDMVSALGPNILGYRDPEVDEAIRRQLSNGISFSLSTELETELADLLCHIIPCAQMARFGKNGTDVTTAAVRLARAYTGRDYVLLSGYHGWGDWSIGTTERNRGVTKQQASCAFRFGDYDVFKNIDVRDVAAVIVEPNEDGEYLQWLRNYCDHHGIVLIFDEILTGFRYAMGGAQEYFGITPDLATFGKSMGNGMPINALVGKREIMKLLEPPNAVFYSGTFQGETLSIAAAIATIRKLRHESVPQRLAQRGRLLAGQVNALLVTYCVPCIQLKGHPSRIVINFSDSDDVTAEQIKTLFIREMIQHGVLIINSHTLSLAHGEPELKRVIQAYDRTLATIDNALKNGTLKELLGNTPILPAHTSVRSFRVA